jgi:uncharacterized protein YndB with AHSA1/START domain
MAKKSHSAEPVVVTRVVDASPEDVWNKVSDLTRMGEWSPENQGGEWIKGATGPAVGARFKGHNSNGKRSWSTVVVVTEYEPQRRITFALMVGPSAWCDWIYEVEPKGTGTLVTHSWVDRRSKFASWLGGVVSGVKDRASHNRRNMEATLEALAR